ncbi:unnamed protein product, partial [Brenthis ino]
MNSVPVLLFAFITKCQCEPKNGYNYNNGNDVSQFGQILKPPPPPPSPIFPVPFHGGSGRLRQNYDHGYQYQPPPPPPLPPISPSTEFKFPAPFYKQYNFNFVPPPQPFSTTPSPSLFQKVSGWLFPSQQVSPDTGSDVSYNVASVKKDCNPCNLVPWIPVIRYDLASKNLHQNINPTYGPPSPTIGNNFNAERNVAQRFNPQNNIQQTSQISSGVPHAVYGPPASHINNENTRIHASTYGPPSPTHSVTISNVTPLNSKFSSGSHHEGQNSSPRPSSTYRLPSSSQNVPYSIYNSPASSYSTPSVIYNNHFLSPTQNPVSTNYNPDIINQHLPSQNDLHELEPSTELRLPKVSHPTGFRNSYGEPITNTYALDIPYSVSAPAASTKINTQVLPDNYENSNANMTLALANPAPFSFNRGRNIHTLQPVALPNLSVSPLPPIFNARPFRPFSTNYPFNIVHGINHLQSQSNYVDIAKSVPIAEYTHSVEYPTTIIQSPVIDIDELKKSNQSKAYRNIANSYEIDELPQASEDHISATKSNQDASFESISPGLTNDLYDSSIPLDLKQSPNAPFNHKASFADLRGVKDEDVDKYRTESNLQFIDSPLLYLKPSAPHKNFKSFMFPTSTPGKQHEYEIYDEYIPTTSSPTQTINNLDETKNRLNEDFSHTIAEEENRNQPKIVQIIVPYTTGQRIDTNKNSFSPSQEDVMDNTEQEYKARKIQSHTENSYYSFVTEGTSSLMTTTEEPMTIITEQYDPERLNTPAILNDLYDVKEPPFDIIKLQHTIDDWTEQEYSNHYHIPQRTRSNEKFAKQIPDEYLTTVSPIINYMTEASYNFEYDHEGSSSIQHTVTENRTNNLPVNRKEYNTIQRDKSDNNGKNEEAESNKKLHIYTAASTFRTTTTTTTTTPAPWGHIQTSISPLTNEKVYVVTSKPWKETNETDSDKQEYDYEGNEFNSKRTEFEDSSELDDLPFKSPRFSNRPSYGFTADAIESIKLDSPYGFSKGWHRRINNLGNAALLSNENTYYEEDKASQVTFIVTYYIWQYDSFSTPSFGC